MTIEQIVTDEIRRPPVEDWWHRAPTRRAKEQRPCCVARRDGLGRLPIGFCSSECLGVEDLAEVVAYHAWRSS